MHRKMFCVLTFVCCTVLFSDTVIFKSLSGSEDGNVWVAQDGEKERCFVAIECYIHPAEKRILAFDQPGTLDFVLPEEGDTVKPDDIVAGLSAEEAEAAFKASINKANNETKIQYAEKSQDVAQAEYDKAIKTNQNRANTRSGLEIRRLELELDKNISSVELEKQEKVIAGLERDQAKAKLSSYRITGRINGVVTKIFKKPGEAVRQGDPVMEVKDTRRVKIEGFLNFTDAVHIKAGDLVIATLELESEDARKFAGSGKEFRGTVIFVDTKASRINPKMSFKVDFDNSDGNLIPGLTATLKVYPDEQGPKVPKKKKPVIKSLED